MEIHFKEKYTETIENRRFTTNTVAADFSEPASGKKKITRKPKEKETL